MNIDQVVWALFWLLTPAYGFVAFKWIAPLWGKHGDNGNSPYPWYQLCVAAVYFLLLAVQTQPGFLHSRTSNVLLLALNASIIWAIAIKLGLDWWKARRAKPTHME